MVSQTDENLIEEEPKKITLFRTENVSPSRPQTNQNRRDHLNYTADLTKPRRL
jgi:hypothetical protein